MSQNNSNALKPVSDADKSVSIDSSEKPNLQSIQKNSTSEDEHVVKKIDELSVSPPTTSKTSKSIKTENDSSGFTITSKGDVKTNSKTSQNHLSEISDNLKVVSQNIKQENIPTTSSNLEKIKPLNIVQNAMACDAYSSEKQRKLRELQTVRNEHVSKLPGIKKAYSKILVEKKYETIGNVLDKFLELNMNRETFNNWMKSIGIKHELWINECYKSLSEWGTKENELKMKNK